jgi:transglutaminase-like putative cysteine protease
MPVFRIHHITRYEYDRPVKESFNEIKIFPYKCDDQETLQHELNVTDNPAMQLFTDYWGNRTGVFNLLHPHKELVIESKLVVRTTAPNQLRVNFQSGWKELEKEISETLQLLELTKAEEVKSQTGIKKIIEQINHPGKSIAAVTEACCEYIYKNFRYIKGITDIETTVDEILEHRSGVCQDFAHVMLQLLRMLKIPSRYVSGYICPNKNGMRGEGATHAWVEAWIPQYGWAGIDPTNNVWTTNTHIKLAVGRNFHDCTPAKGIFKGPAKQLLSVYVSVGYEDGHVFEEVNKVNMLQKEASLPPEETVETFAGQQQQ